MKRSILLIALGLVSSHCLSQGFLLIAPSPGGNGMGGISSGLAGTDPFAQIANPGQLGIQTLSEHILGGVASSTQWFPGFNISGATYRADAVSAGANLHDLINTPFNISFGLGYSSVHLDWAGFTVSQVDPSLLETFSAWDQSKAVTFGIGLDYVIRLGVGFSVKKIESHLLPFGTAGEMGSGSASVTASDFGAIATLPCTRLLPGIINIVLGFEPIVDLNASCTRNNVGDEISYIRGWADPLPRVGTVGISLEIGAVSHISGNAWKVISLTVARQGDDILASRNRTGAIEYRGGFGRTNIIRNLVLGKHSDEISLRKGVQLNILELFSYRNGSVDGDGFPLYTTTGMGFRLSGLWHVLRALDASSGQTGILGFLMKHVDITYSTSKFDIWGSFADKSKYSGFGVTVK